MSSWADINTCTAVSAFGPLKRSDAVAARYARSRLAASITLVREAAENNNIARLNIIILGGS